MGIESVAMGMNLINMQQVASLTMLDRVMQVQGDSLQKMLAVLPEALPAGYNLMLGTLVDVMA